MPTSRSRSCLIALLLFAACATAPARNEPPQQAELARAVAPPERADPPAYLPASARDLLRQRMTSHARDMGELVSAIMVLRYEQIHEQAEALANDVSLARPLTGDATELNSALPEAFFQRQDELKVRARGLAQAATAMDAFAVAAAYGRVSETCVRCHATFRPGR
jgi:cytochrome c556